MPRYCPNPDCPDLADVGEAAEYRDGVETCPECGELLVEGHLEEADEVPLLLGELMLVARYRSLDEAQPAWSRLAAEGIPAALEDAQLIGVDWLYSDAVGGIKLEVRPEDAERARAALADESQALAAEPDPRAPLRTFQRRFAALVLLVGTPGLYILAHLTVPVVNGAYAWAIRNGLVEDRAAVRTYVYENLSEPDWELPVEHLDLILDLSDVCEAPDEVACVRQRAREAGVRLRGKTVAEVLALDEQYEGELRR